MTQLRIQHLREATLWRYGYMFTQGGLSLLLYIALGHALSSAAFPACATALGVLVIAQAAADFGLSLAAVVVLPNPGALKQTFSRPDLESGAALAFLLAGAAGIVLCLVAALVVPASAAAAVVSVAPAAATAVAVAGADGILRAEGEFRRPVVIVGLSRLGAFAAVPAAGSGSAAAACIGLSAGTITCSLPALRLLIARLQRGNPRHTVVPFAAAAAPLGISNAAVIASARINTVILGGISSLRAAAVFEGAWRVFQVGQYAIGAAPAAAGPFIAHALSEGRHRELRQALRRTAWFIILGGGLFAGLLLLARDPIDRALFGTLGAPIAHSLLWLVPVVPINLLALLMTVTLAAATPADRRWVGLAYLVGAVFNVCILLAIASAHPDVAGAVGAAAGILATTVVLVIRFRSLMHELGPGSGRSRAAASASEPWA